MNDPQPLTTAQQHWPAIVLAASWFVREVHSGAINPARVFAFAKANGGLVRALRDLIWVPTVKEALIVQPSGNPGEVTPISGPKPPQAEVEQTTAEKL